MEPNKLPYQSSLLEREVVLIIPSDHGKVQSWQLDVAQKFTQKELLLKEEVFQKIFDQNSGFWNKAILRASCTITSELLR